MRDCSLIGKEARLSVDGSVKRPPVCIGLKTYKIVEKGRSLYFDLNSAGGVGKDEERFSFKVVSNNNVATFIKELVLKPAADTNKFSYRPGDYIHLEIPAHETSFRSIHVNEPYARIWKDNNIYTYHSFNHT